MAPRTGRPGVAALGGLVLLTALVGCSSGSEAPAESLAESPAPSDAASTPAAGSPDGAAAQAAMESEARNLATAQETYVVDNGAYADDPGELDADLTGEMRSLDVGESSYRFCLVDAATGAWAAYDSADGGITGTGPEGGECIS